MTFAVGADVKNDFLENVTTYAMDERIRLEELESLSAAVASEPQMRPTEVISETPSEGSDDQGGSQIIHMVLRAI